MDIGTVRGIGTAVVMIAFVGVTLWAFSNRRKSGFDEAANLPFADDEPEHPQRDPQASSRSKSE